MTVYKWQDSHAATVMEMYIASGKDNSKLEPIALAVGTTVQSVRGKLAVMGIYAKSVKTTKAGTPSKASETKADVMKAIEIMLSVPTGELASLDKGTVKSVNSLFEALKTLSLVTNGKLGLKES